ncbi:S1C family serine protease [Leptothrix sp. BB-4]
MHQYIAGLALVLCHMVSGAQDASSVFQKSRESIYVVHADKGSTAVQGSAVQLDSRNVVTNCHVVEGAKSIVLVAGGRRLAATLALVDQQRDLCTLRVEVNLKAIPPPIRSVSSLVVGERVFALGAPRGLELSLSEGIISALRETAEGLFIQTTAAISPGSSGGALLDANGRLIGVTTYQRRESQNINFAAPASWISELHSRNAPLVVRRLTSDERTVKLMCKGLVKSSDPISIAVRGAREWAHVVEIELNVVDLTARVSNFFPSIIMSRTDTDFFSLAFIAEGPYKMMEYGDVLRHFDVVDENTVELNKRTSLSIEINRKTAEVILVEYQLVVQLKTFSVKDWETRGQYACQTDADRKF